MTTSNRQLEFNLDSLDVASQITRNFTTPLEIFREAIANAYDHEANNISIHVGQGRLGDRPCTIVEVSDDGNGMVQFDDEIPVGMHIGSLESFFRVGNSLSRGDQSRTGEKGLGIKVGLRCKRLEVITRPIGKDQVFSFRCEDPLLALSEHRNLAIEEFEPGGDNGLEFAEHGTTIRLWDPFDGITSHFQVKEIKDYIQWFTRWGSFENEIENVLAEETVNREAHMGFLRSKPSGTLKITAFGASDEIEFGHPFPIGIQKNRRVDEFLSDMDRGLSNKDWYIAANEKLEDQWIYFCRTGSLENAPEVKWQCVVSVEGSNAKRTYNDCLRSRRSRVNFDYRAEERYGVWFAKDFVPIYDATNDMLNVTSWRRIAQRGRFKMLFNCQSFELTAERTSVGPTRADWLSALNKAAGSVFEELLAHEDFLWQDAVEEYEAEQRTELQEERDLRKRKEVARRLEVIKFPDDAVAPDLLSRIPKLTVPKTEAETVLLLERLKFLFPEEFSFYQPNGWQTSKGLDCFMHAPPGDPHEGWKFAEFKLTLTKNLNHTFKYMDYLICWNLASALRNGTNMLDSAGKSARLRKYDDWQLPSDFPWLIETRRGQRKIQVVPLQQIIEQQLNGRLVDETAE